MKIGVRFYRLDHPFSRSPLNLSGRSIWQQAAGDNDRHYAAICLKWDVVLNGPGNFGAWPDCRSALSKSVSSRKVSDIERFAVEMAPGDLIVLRVGTSAVLGVGEVTGTYEWCSEFGDVDGWDLQHVRRVRWLWKGDPGPRRFDVYAMKLGDTTQRLNNGPVTDWLANLDLPSEAFTRPLVTLPRTEGRGDITIDEISDFLFDHGVASASIKNLVTEIGELIRIARWYSRFTKPSEHETVAYLAVPLLRALGWTPQRMAVEWNFVDVALFERLPRCDANLRVVVEAKKMGRSCLTANSQAKSYADGKVQCHRLIVTDGLRYGIYAKSEDGEFHLYAYMNLTRLRHDYPALLCKGAEDALLAMAPEWKMAAT